MPRRPKKDHQVRRLREIIGKTQRDFARMIGVSTSTLQRIELGSLKLSSDVASRILAVTDVEEECLRRVGRSIKHASGEDYDREHFERCQRRFRSQAMEHECAYVTAELCDRISILLHAAISRRRFPLVASDLWSAISKLRKRYQLEPLTNELLKKNPHKVRAKWTNIAPPGKLVFFDDKGHQFFSESDNVRLLTSRLSIGHESLAYGLSDKGFVIEISRAVSSSNRDATKKRPASRSPAARLRSKQPSEIRKPKA